MQACGHEHVSMSRVTDLNLLAGSVHGGQGEGLVLGLPLPYQPLHICSVLSTQRTLLQPPTIGCSHARKDRQAYIQVNMWSDGCTILLLENENTMLSVQP